MKIFTPNPKNLEGGDEEGKRGKRGISLEGERGGRRERGWEEMGPESTLEKL